ncbi:MAG: GNAT family N-acetyltransferase [Desulfurococcales archaeon]|nr:GNAT family N-acetyltransferase [Desulfurococcales archaeon]
MYEPSVVVRKALPDDIPKAADLIYRFYLFNEEFDPAWAAVEDRSRAEELARNAVESEREILLVAEENGEVVGVARAVLEENPMLEASPLAVLKELYVKPEYRRRGIASLLVEEAFRALQEAGARALAAEFPAQNRVAKSFYEKLGFRAFRSVYIREA